MRQKSAGRPDQPGPGVHGAMRAHLHREDAGAADRRQARLVRLLLASVLASLAAGECRATDRSPSAVPDAGVAGSAASPPEADKSTPPPTPPPADRQRQLLDEHRRVRGQLQTLDRRLAPYEQEKLRTRPADPRVGPPSISRQDPVSERGELERRNLQFRQRQIESELRRSPGSTNR